MTEEAKDLVAKDPDLQPGTMVGEYKVQEKIGSGGFGTVYRAVHPLIGKPAAIKVLHRQFSANVEMVERFVSEARAVNQIRHRGIIDVFSFGQLPDGRQYYVMELLEGATLDELLQEKKRFRIDEVIPIVRPVARALDAAHAAGIAHRDLKPENVFISFDDESRPVPKILDFGIAKLMGERSGVRTQTGTPLGTPKYMSPEQARGIGVDHRTDVYSFGVMVFEMLTGDVPFKGGAVMDILLKQITEPPPAPSSVCDEVPLELDAPILRMLSKDPEERPRTLTAAVEELAAASGVSLQPTPSTTDLASVLRSHQAKSERALAKTLPHQVTGPTLVGSTSEVGTSIPPGKKRTWMVGAVAAASLVFGVGIAFLTVKHFKSSAAAQPTVSVSASAPVVPVSTVEPIKEPPKSKEISVTVRGAPKDAEVWLGAERIGTTPGPIKLPRGAGTITISIKATGYKPKDAQVDTSDDATVIVTMDKQAGGVPSPWETKGGKTSHPEIENPF